LRFRFPNAGLEENFKKGEDGRKDKLLELRFAHFFTRRKKKKEEQ